MGFAVLLRWFYLLALALWLGEVVFFSFVVAPSIFKVLPVPDAGRVVGAIFPRYYALGMAYGAICAGTATHFWWRSGGAWWAATAALVGAMLVCTTVAATVVHPKAAALRERMHASASVTGAPAIAAEFNRLHRRSVELNAAVLLLGLAATGTTVAAWRP